MNNKQVSFDDLPETLERKLSNRSTRLDLFNRGIIQNVQTDYHVAQKLNLLKKNQTQHVMNNKLQSRPSKTDLVKIGILEGQDYETTQQVKEFISEHLANRPGPLDVYRHLVSSESDYGPQLDPIARQNLAFDSCQKFNPSPTRGYSSSCPYRPYVSVDCNAATQSAPSKGARRGGSKTYFVPKFKNITFHEFVPGKSGSNGKFVRSDGDSKRGQKKTHVNEHYEKLIEQQAKFLQLELNMKQPNAFMDPDVNWDKIDLNPCSHSPQEPLHRQNVDFDFTTSEMDLLDQMKDQLNTEYRSDHSESLFTMPAHPQDCNRDELSDIISSGINIAYPSSECGIFEKQYLGFGLSNDCDSFNSVGEKIELFERLQSSAIPGTRIYNNYRI